MAFRCEVLSAQAFRPVLLPMTIAEGAFRLAFHRKVLSAQAFRPVLLPMAIHQGCIPHGLLPLYDRFGLSPLE